MSLAIEVGLIDGDTLEPRQARPGRKMGKIARRRADWARWTAR